MAWLYSLECSWLCNMESNWIHCYYVAVSDNYEIVHSECQSQDKTTH